LHDSSNKQNKYKIRNGRNLYWSRIKFYRLKMTILYCCLF